MPPDPSPDLGSRGHPKMPPTFDERKREPKDVVSKDKTSNKAVAYVIQEDVTLPTRPCGWSRPPGPRSLDGLASRQRKEPPSAQQRTRTLRARTQTAPEDLEPASSGVRGATEAAVLSPRVVPL
ncbi:hypothetical protein ColTof3_04335 [Colletotrichum tofieldiae]|nr:hypothetical protein ColTof3_04335 [Colletotrichum tofieldiae]